MLLSVLRGYLMSLIDGLIYGLVLVVVLLLAFIFLSIFWGSVLVIIYILVGAYLIDPRPIRRGNRYDKRH